MEDYIISAAGADAKVRVYAAYTKNLVEEARKIHNTSPVATAALGRLLTAGCMMGSMMKGESDLLTLSIKCTGPIGGLTVTASSNGNVKGYVYDPDVMLPPSSRGKLDVGGAVGSGILSVIRDMGLKEPYIGQTDLISGEIAEDLTYYFSVSEQTSSSVALGVLMSKDNTVAQAGGFILQLMPGADDELINRLEENIAGITSVTDLLSFGLTPEDIIEKLLKGYDVDFFERREASYVCDCTRQRVERALISVGRDELLEMIKEGEPIEAGCQFCGKHYKFTVKDLKELLLKSE